MQTTSARGQTLIIIALSFVALMGIISLVFDVGRLLVEIGHIRRAVDAASLAAAAQYREGRTLQEMEAVGREVMELNGVPSTNIIVQTCASTGGTDAELCTTPRRKLVRVRVEADVPTTFLGVLGIPVITLSNEAIGEAAAMDVVLLIDVSESMTSDAHETDPMRDPKACNDADPTGADGFPGECHPFEEVKIAAARFARRILNQTDPMLEEDRLAIVTFSNGWEAWDPNDRMRGTHFQPTSSYYWIQNQGEALSIIENLKVYEPYECPRTGSDLYECVDYGNSTMVGSCRCYTPSRNFIGIGCPLYQNTLFGNDPSSCTTTNVGGALLLAGNMFTYQTRPGALWVVVLLTDGAANASSSDPPDHIYGYCPDTTWEPPFCRDNLVRTRHSLVGSPDYDADDYARAMADFVGCYPTNPASACVANGQGAGQGAVIFTVGLGNLVLSPDADSPAVPYGASLLRYIAAVGYDGDPATDLCAGTPWTEWCGNYYFSPTGDQLNRVFEDIASRIFTRLTK